MFERMDEPAEDFDLPAVVGPSQALMDKSAVELALRVFEHGEGFDLREALVRGLDVAAYKQVIADFAHLRLSRDLPAVLDRIAAEAKKGEPTFVRLFLELMGLSGKGAQALVQVVNQFGLSPEERRVLEADLVERGVLEVEE